MRILDRKMGNIEASGAEVVLAGNPGCMLQLDYGRRASGTAAQVLHPVQVVDAAYRAQGNQARYVGVDSGQRLRTRRGQVVAIAADGVTRVRLGRVARERKG
jgi:glycolate oxidase iron-sulfur subunit